MAKLPYTYTICPPDDPPKQYTAMTPQMLKAMIHSSDLTIDQRSFAYPSRSSNFEGRLEQILQTVRVE